MCGTFGVTRSGFYRWRGSAYKTASEEAELVSKIKDICEGSRNTYGSPRVTASLRKQGFVHNRKKIERLMRVNGIKSKKKRAYKSTTNSDHSQPIADNIINRDFAATVPNQKYVADTTYISTAVGWLYLAVIIDLFSRRVVGWATSDRNTKELVVAALQASLSNRGVIRGAIHHSDRGSQYASFKFREQLSLLGMVCSMSRRSNCWDNSVAESFFASLKWERVEDTIYPDRIHAHEDICDYIRFYNYDRLHSTLDYCSPVEFERAKPTANTRLSTGCESPPFESPSQELGLH
jgi:putative transposase